MPDTPQNEIAAERCRREGWTPGRLLAVPFEHPNISGGYMIREISVPPGRAIVLLVPHGYVSSVDGMYHEQAKDDYMPVETAQEYFPLGTVAIGHVDECVECGATRAHHENFGGKGLWCHTDFSCPGGWVPKEGSRTFTPPDPATLARELAEGETQC